MKKKTLGTNPLQAYFESTKESAQVNNTDHPDGDVKIGELVKKQRITIHLPIDLIERIKNVVYWEPGFTLTAFAQHAFEQAISDLEKERGSAYAPRKERSLKGGRPLI